MRLILLGALASISVSAVVGQTTVSEEIRMLETYPFSEPNPVPILTSDVRLYPYHTFEGYSLTSTPQPWKVVKLENDLIEVFVLPEVGGKVWGAVVKSTGHEFIYRNEVMKFRNIALRGPWTSGGIEFNFGVIGHTPSTATSVDYTMQENEDGSASVIVGAMDLPSRTHWRVEIRLAPGKAFFETNVLWYNPTPLEQPYYNWMTAAAFAQDDLVVTIPGNVFLEHGGSERAWPTSSEGRYLPAYANNNYEGHKSFHVVGELNDFFGGYYHDEDYGFGHWSRHEEMPGQKLWLWASSREGGIWEDLLTDTDGQYVEYQAGRLFVQFSPDATLNPITQVGFAPGATDRWSEIWFPLEGTRGLSDASRNGAMSVQIDEGTLTVRVNAFSNVSDTLTIRSGADVVARVPVALRALEVWEHGMDVPGPDIRVLLPGLGLDYTVDPSERELTRSFSTDPAVEVEVPVADRLAFGARELAKARRYRAAAAMFAEALVIEPWHRVALLGSADLEGRRGRYAEGLVHAQRALQLDAYDAEANFVTGNLFRGLGMTLDARGAFGWAIRSPGFRTAGYVQLAELAMEAGDAPEAVRYAELAIDYDRYNLPARQILTMLSRHAGDANGAAGWHRQMLEIDPLHHFVAVERALAGSVSSSGLMTAFRSEYPEQSILELAVDYARRGARQDAARLLELAGERIGNPVLDAWLGWLQDDARRVNEPASVPFAFPYRPETLPVLEWATARNHHWSWSYLHALNLWALDRPEDAAAIMRDIGERSDYGPFYVARAMLLHDLVGQNPEADLRRAVELARDDRSVRIHLIRYYQDQARWEDALRVSGIGRDLFPDDFNLDLLHVRALNHLGQVNAAMEIMDDTHVLPSESGRQSHRLFAQAHTLAGLRSLEENDWPSALGHLNRALEWPERLGQGRPYEPEERLVQFLIGVAALGAGDRRSAEAAWDAVVAATNLRDVGAVREDILAIVSLNLLARGSPPDEPVTNSNTDEGRFARALIRETKKGYSIAVAIRNVIGDFDDLFSDLDGRSLERALRTVR